MTGDSFRFHIPRWDELPDLELYLDQVVKVLEEYLIEFNTDKDERIITKTMINNYVKQGIIQPPINKKYNRTHIACLFVICILKQVYSINDVKELIRLALGVSHEEVSYNKFCKALEKSIENVFKNQVYVEEERVTATRRLLKSVAQSYATKLYVAKTFLNK